MHYCDSKIKLTKHYKTMKKRRLLCLCSKKKTKTKPLLAMKLTLLIILFAVFQLNASLYSQNGLFNIDVKNSSMREIFKEIEKQSELRFFYNDLLTNIDRKLSITANNLKIEDLLDKLLVDSDITYKIMENNLILISPKALLQQRSVSGTVLAGDSREPLPGVNILEKGTSKGTIS